MRESTFDGFGRILKHLARHVNLNNPEAVLTYIASKDVSEARKEVLVNCYDKHCVNQPSGYKVVNELNGLEAFVTFFNTSPKYEDPGTEGFLARDMVTTVYPPHVQRREHT